MHHFFVPSEQIEGDIVHITGSDVRHIRNVLRMKEGDEIHVRTGEDNREYRCRLLEVQPSASGSSGRAGSGYGAEDEIQAQICWVEEQNVELPSQLVLYQGLPKSDKMEWIVQKAVELGAARIVPVDMKRSILRLSGAKADKRIARWQAISESAAKQSRRMIIPEVSPIMTWSQAVEDAAKLDHFFVPYELADDMDKTRALLSGIAPGQSVGIMIGPEGGIAPEEVNLALTKGAGTITLGRRILRTETAGLAVLSALMISLEGR